MKKSLFDISSEYLIALEELETHCQTNDTDEVPEGINDRLVINQDEFEDKLGSYFFVLTELNGDLDTMKAHIKAMNQKKKAIENNISRLKNYVGNALELYGEENKSGNKFYKHKLFKVTATRSNILLVTSKDDLDEIYKEEVITTSIKVDTKKLKADLNDPDKPFGVNGAKIDNSKINVTFR